MQPSDIRELVSSAAAQGYTHSWLILLLAAIASAIGAFFGAYLKRRGDDWAAEENFAAIRAQLKATTKDTEEIKQYLSAESWRYQQQWSTQERYYSSLLAHLRTFQIALLDLSDYYMEPGSEHTPDHKQGEHFEKLLTVAHESHKEIQKLLGPSALYLSDKAVAALGKLSRKYWTAANHSACTADYVSELTDAVDSSYKTVLAEARKQLKLAAASDA